MVFHKNREAQIKADVSACGFFDEHMTLSPGIIRIYFSTQLFPGEPVTALNSFRDGPYIYGEAKNGKLTVIGKMDDVVSFAAGTTATISAGDFSMETTLMIGESENGNFLEFEGVCIFRYPREPNLFYRAQMRRRILRLSKPILRRGLLCVRRTQRD